MRERQRRAERGEHKDPEQHGALVVPPDAREFVDEWLVRMRIFGDVEHAEIIRRVRESERSKGDGGETKQRQRRGAGARHEPRVAARSAKHWEQALMQSGHQGEDEGDLADFRHHAYLPRSVFSSARRAGRLEWAGGGHPSTNAILLRLKTRDIGAPSRSPANYAL